MKSLLTILGILVVSSTAAHAADQVKECGVNIAQVQQIINEHDEWNLSERHAYKFVGSWGEAGQVKVEANGTFNYDQYRFKVCPQKDGRMVIINIDDPSYVGVLSLFNRNMMKIAGFTGIAGMKANGVYPRYGTSAVATGRGSGEF